MPETDARILDSPAQLVAALLEQGWRVIGPVEQDGAIHYQPLNSADDLPRGRKDAQSPGRYALGDSENPDRWFDYVVGPQSWKSWLFPSRQKLWSADKTKDGFAITPGERDWPKTAFFGVRPCELAAMERQDDVFDNGSFADPDYGHRRANTLTIVVNCARAAETCFCASMNTGPRADNGYDLALTELEQGGHRFLLEIGSERGEAIAAALAPKDADEADRTEARAVSASTAAAQTRKIPSNIAQTLADNPEHPHWTVVADKCLNCANCTLACPTCFCSDVEDVNDLSGEHTERWRVWDSCFGTGFSYIHGGEVRKSPASRYRQWMTHKLSSWHDQFGSSGCVGCGRCIAWCPVGIDITEEAAAMTAAPED